MPCRGRWCWSWTTSTSLHSPEALDGLEQLLGATPAQLRTIILSRRDPKLGLHRLRLAGELTEIRAADLEFTAGGDR